MTRARTKPGCICAALFLGTVLLFARTAAYDFIDYDDPDFVTQNEWVQAGLTVPGVAWAFTSGGQAANWQPLTWLSLMLDAEVQGVHGPAFHRTNILWHALNTVLAFLLLLEFCRSPWTAAWGAAVFGWHPLRVESVAWVSERKDVLSVFFALLSLWAYARHVRARERGEPARRVYALALATFVAGLLCKPMLVTLPFVFLLIDWAEGQRRLSWRAQVAEKLPFLLAALACGLVTLNVQAAGGAMNGAFSWPHRVVNALVSLARYGELSFWPHPLALAYPHPQHWRPLRLIGTAVVLGGVAALALTLGRGRRWLLPGLGWFVVMLLPVLGFIPAGPQAMANRYTYLPSIGLLLAIIAVVEPFGKRLRASLLPLGLGTVAACAACTWHELGYWQDSTLLFERSLSVTDDNYLAYTARGTTLLNAGEAAPAAVYYRSALAIAPDYAPAAYGLGAALEARGLPAAALANYRHAIAVAPQYAEAHTRLGILLLGHDQAEAARAELVAAARLRPSELRNQLGVALAEAALQRPVAAAQAFAHALAAHPASAMAHKTFADFLARSDQWPEAAFHYEAALRLRPTWANAHFNYANGLADQGEHERALFHYQEARRLNPDDADFAFAVGAALEESGRPAEAAGAYAASVRLTPSHAMAQAALRRLRSNHDSPDADAQAQRVPITAGGRPRAVAGVDQPGPGGREATAGPETVTTPSAPSVP